MAEDAPADDVQPAAFPPDQAFAQLVLLCMRSEVHRRWSVDDLANNFLPAIGQHLKNIIFLGLLPICSQN